MTNFIIYLLILKIALCQDQLQKNTCVGDVEIAFSTDKLKATFEGAKLSCKTFGGHLVKIGNATIQTAIENAIIIEEGQGPQFYAHYIGAYDDDGNNAYNWLVDDTPVRENPVLIWPGPSSGYQNWKRNQPNDVCQKCVILGEHSVHTWSDASCGNTRQYICQRAFIIRITEAASSVTCQSPVSTVGVIWEKNSAIVGSSDKGEVYQTIGTSSATLNYANANIAEAGNYTCTTTNSSCPAIKTYTVPVDGTPTIQSITNNKCNSSLFVTWKPNNPAVGFIHRFTANSSSTVKYVTPTTNNSLTTEFTGLETLTAHIIAIQVCKSQDSCTTPFTAQRDGTTGGVTDPVNSTTLQRNGATCKTVWNTPDNSAAYTIETNCTLANHRSRDKVQPSTNRTENWKTTTFLFQPKPNRLCSATIWAKGCGNISTPVEATGSCITPPKEPDNIIPPKLTVNGASRTINLTRPSEDNGLISCIFIVLCYKGCSASKFTVQDLETASQTDVTNNTDQANSIALAIKMANVTENWISRTLSEGEGTSCELNNTGRATAKSTTDNVIEGKNVIDDSTKNVWAYAVTSTPSGNEILLQTGSPIVVLEEDLPSTSEFLPWIIGPISGIIIISILLIIVVLLIRRQRKQQQQNECPNANGNEAGVQHAETRLGGSMRAPRQFENPMNPGEEGGYMNFVAPMDDGTSINVRDLESRYNNMKNSGTFKVQYDEIVQKAGKLRKTTNAAKEEAVIKKNRYKNILPFDDSRVTLSGSGSGYVNASFVNGFRQPNRYIATQGPLKSTVADFWLMTMEQNSQIIVMLTREYDAGKKKCEKYWPDFGKTLNFTNGISVESRQETSCNSYIERILFLQNKVTGKILTTYQYQFMKWPDHGVPQTTSNLMRMQRVVTKKLNELGSQAPIIVHCSAGAGRTGAFIAYDILLKESQATGKVDVYECVMEMRKRRIQMVQNCDQYILVYKLLVEENIFDDCDASADQVKAKVQEIMATPEGAKQLEKEFGQLDRIEPMKNRKLIGAEKNNRPYNRGRLTVPYDYSLVGVTTTMGESAVPYINASFVEAYDKSTKLIAAQGPFEKTLDIFWRAVMDNNVTTIVMLCDLVERREEQSAQYWPPTVGGATRCGDITVAKTSDEAIGNITQRNMELTRGTEVKFVTQFHFTGWKEDSCPGDARELLDLISKMQKHSCSAGEGGAVLVHCNDGIGRTGAFCAIVNLIDRMKWENRIDVFRTVKDLRDGRPYMVKTLDQYQFCYRAIVDYLKSFELYANF